MTTFCFFFFFFNDTATTEIYTLSLHDALPILRPVLLRQRRRNCCVPCNAGWQAHGEHRAVAGLARHRDVAAHHAGELAGDGEAQARTAEPLRGRGVALAELLEQFAELLARHADPGIGDGELDVVAHISVFT